VVLCMATGLLLLLLLAGLAARGLTTASSWRVARHTPIAGPAAVLSSPWLLRLHPTTPRPALAAAGCRCSINCTAAGCWLHGGVCAIAVWGVGPALACRAQQGKKGASQDGCHEAANNNPSCRTAHALYAGTASMTLAHTTTAGTAHCTCNPKEPLGVAYLLCVWSGPSSCLP
jgi:hypothetical protein